eukprot:14456369-Ditylum_brightwellii.AAC.2
MRNASHGRTSPMRRKSGLTRFFFTKVICDHRRLYKAAGMHYQANSVIQENLQQDTVDALANLALATADDRNAVANLTSANSTLVAQIKALNEHSTKKRRNGVPQN